MMTDQDFLTRLDAAIGCQQCGGPLGDSPSGDFCDDECQRAWRSQNAEPLPWSPDAALVYPGRDMATWSPDRRPECTCSGTSIRGCARWAPPEWRLPRSTGDIAADTRAWRRASDSARTDAQRAACRLRIEDIKTRNLAQHARDWTLPRSTGDLGADFLAANRARRMATTDYRRAAADLRLEDLRRRQAAATANLGAALTNAFAGMGRAFQEMGAQMIRAFGSLHAVRVDPTTLAVGDQIRLLGPNGVNRHFTVGETSPRRPVDRWTVRGSDWQGAVRDEVCREFDVDHDPSSGVMVPRLDPMADALEARRNRNTGPARPPLDRRRRRR